MNDGIFQVWKQVLPHLTTTKHLEDLDPNVLRQEASSPTHTSIAAETTLSPETQIVDDEPEMKRTKLISV